MQALLCGDLDVVLGRLPVQFYDEALEIEQLVGESMSVVAKPGHSLFDLAKVTLVEVVMQTWTLHPLGSPMRKRVEQAMQHVSAAAPPAIVEASLILATTTLLEPRDMNRPCRWAWQNCAKLGLMGTLLVKLPISVA